MYSVLANARPRGRSAAWQDAVHGCPLLGRFGHKPPQHLRHPCPADAEMPGQCRPALELAGVEKCLVMEGQFHPVGTWFLDWPWLRFFVRMSVPGAKNDYGVSL